MELEKLRIFFAKNVFPKSAKEFWKKQGEVDWLDWILKIQQRRNAIHAFKNRGIGNFEEFHSDLKNYLIFLRKINNGLPYPSEVYKPAESLNDNTYEEIRISREDGSELRWQIKQGKLISYVVRRWHLY